MESLIFNIENLNEAGTLKFGVSLNESPIYFLVNNSVIGNTENTSINTGEITTEEMIDQHLLKYGDVWEALS